MYLDKESLQALCRSSAHFTEFCSEDNEYFWKHKAHLEFKLSKQYKLIKPENVSWKTVYTSYRLK